MTTSRNEAEGELAIHQSILVVSVSRVARI